MVVELDDPPSYALLNSCNVSLNDVKASHDFASVMLVLNELVSQVS